MVNQFFHKYKSSTFVKNALTLTIGTTIAQILPFAFYPIFSRIYSPEQFGFFYTIISIIPVLTILSTGMFEHAILISKDEDESNNVIKLILLRTIISLFIISVLFLFAVNFISFFDFFLIYKNWFFVSILIAFFTIIYNVFNEWSIRLKKFNHLAFNKIYNSTFTSISKVAAKYLSLFNNGLIIGEFLGKFITSIICVKSVIKYDKTIFDSTKLSEIKAVYLKHKNFPKYMMPDQLINTLGGSIHVYIIGLYFGNIELGYISMALSLLTVPVTVISSAIKDVFRQKANELYIVTGSCRELYVKLLKPVFVFGLLLFFLLFFIVPYVFPIFLGDKWITAGEYAQYLMPVFFLNFVSMSLGGVLVIANEIRVSLYWQIYNVITTVIALFIGALFFKSMIVTITLLVIAKSSSYLIYIYLSYKYSQNTRVN